MNASRRPAVIGLATVGLAVALAAVSAGADGRQTSELPAFALWCAPLGLAVAAFARRPRFMRLPPPARAIAASVVGLLAGLVSMEVGVAGLGPWMLAWDFPVFYCWTIAGAAGAVGAAVWTRAVAPGDLPAGIATAVVPLAALAWFGTRPVPAVIIVYRDVPGRDVAGDVYNSLPTRASPGVEGRDLRWNATMYARTHAADGRTAALLGLNRAADCAVVPAALARDPRVAVVADTVLPR